MNSRCICAAMRGGTGQTLLPALPFAVMGTRMRFPGYPSNREADERARMSLRVEKNDRTPWEDAQGTAGKENVTDAQAAFVPARRRRKAMRASLTDDNTAGANADKQMRILFFEVPLVG